MKNNTTAALDSLRSAARVAFASGANYKEAVRAVERELLQLALEAGGGERGAAVRLGMRRDHFAFIVGQRHPELSPRRREAGRLNARPNHSRPARRAPGRVLPFKLPPSSRAGR